ncbi:hypothetical protein LC040_09420 [Bacillus tianshenii]|nr:hypothetical protein LC040_09420 [Bacillus tianshenii]
MSYIIENGWVQKENKKVKRNFIIQSGKVASIEKRISKRSLVRMDVSSYVISPGRIYFDVNHIQTSDTSAFKERQRTLIKQGCTTQLVPFRVRYVKDIPTALRRAEHMMINSSIDYVLGVCLPFHKISPKLFRLCRRYHIPFIVTDVETNTNLQRAKWGWWKEANFPNPIPIYPVWKIEDEKELIIKQKEWSTHFNEHRLPTVCHCVNEDKFIQGKALEQIGLYPEKGDLLIGSDVDYILYTRLVDENANLHYDRNIPSIVVLRGKLLKAGDELLLRPGYGKRIDVTMTRRFSSL